MSQVCPNYKLKLPSCNEMYVENYCGTEETLCKPVVKISTVFYKVRSFTNHKKYYIVRNTPWGWKCECYAFMFRKDCDHIRRARKEKMKVHGRLKKTP